MRVAIDTGPLTGGHSVRGIGVHTRELIKELKKSSVSAIKIETVDFSRTDLTKYDLVHYPYFHPYFLTLPSQKPCKKVVLTIHDLIYLHYPDKYPSGIRGKVNFIKQKARLKNVDAIITISQTSKKDIIRFLGVDPNKVHVIYLAPDKVFRKLKNDELMGVKKKYHLPDRFVMFLGDVNYNKNILGLIGACKLVNLPLVLVGKAAKDIESRKFDLRSINGPRDWFRFIFNLPHPEVQHINDLIKEFDNDKHIIRTGYVSNEELVKIFNLATVYCQPSFYEGFGLPIVQSMACGTPVVISKTSALVEVAGGAALIADPKNPKDMAKKITQVINNKKVRNSLIKKGLQRTREFSWEKTAKETIKLFKEVIGEQ